VLQDIDVPAEGIDAIVGKIRNELAPCAATGTALKADSTICRAL
jgi:hypothetical protein